VGDGRVTPFTLNTSFKLAMVAGTTLDKVVSITGDHHTPMASLTGLKPSLAWNLQLLELKTLEEQMPERN
jgi:hypothetical protein